MKHRDNSNIMTTTWPTIIQWHQPKKHICHFLNFRDGRMERWNERKEERDGGRQEGRKEGKVLL
jgi:hypothetical protein